jgi:hypothetical protein
MLSPALASGLEQASPSPPRSAAPTQRLVWLEISPREDACLSPASTHSLAEWHEAGFDTFSQLVHGTAFWQSTEIKEVPALIAATLSAITITSASPIVEFISA